MKKVLMVAYAFPPVGGAGVQRVVKFIKYFSKFGWSADAVSVMNPSVPLIDYSLLNELPSECTIYRSKTFEPSYAVKSFMKTTNNVEMSLKSRIISIVKKCINHVLLPDAQVLWWPHTFFLIRRLLKERNYSVVFVSGPPFSTFFLVVVIAKKLSIPAVIDYRDEWSFSRDNWENAVKTPLAKFIDSWMEGFVIRNAKSITVASPAYERSLKERFPGANGKVFTITNGYDPADFVGADFVSNKNSADDKFIILYTGTVWRATSLQSFLEGVIALAIDSPSITSRIHLRIVGRIVHEELAVIDQLKKLIYVEMLDYLPHEELFSEMVSADLLLLTLTDLPGAGKIIPGKTFEYLATPLPILALIPDGATADIIKNEKNVHIASPSNPSLICNILRNIVNGPRAKDEREGIEKYSRPHLTQKMVDVFEKIS